MLPFAVLIIPLTLLALLRWAGRARRADEPFARYAAVVAGRLLAVRLPLLWAGLLLMRRADWGQIAGYWILVVNFLPELALAGWWKRYGGPESAYAASVAAAVTSLILAAGWTAVAAARAGRRATRRSSAEGS